MTNVVTFARALADATRWRIVKMAMTEAVCVCELADVLGMPQSTVSSHVQIIRKAEILESEKCEKWTYFRVMPAVSKLLVAMEEAFPEMDEQCEADAKKLKERLSQRVDSCCPGPKRLATRKNSRSRKTMCS
jgi:ArsR family transcriptional regulator